MNRNEEILSAFVDGEAVDDEALARALAAPGGREALVDFVRLRERFARDDVAPSETFYARVRPRRAPARPLWPAWAMSAAVVVVLVLGGWAILRRGPAEPEAPAPDRVLEFTEWEAIQ